MTIEKGLIEKEDINRRYIYCDICHKHIGQVNPKYLTGTIVSLSCGNHNTLKLKHNRK